MPQPAANQDRLLVSVIVPVHNGGEDLLRLVEHLRSQTLGQERFEVIVADDGSTDGTPERLPVDERWLRLSSGARRNSYVARNRGAGVARAPVLAFTDADCMPDPSWLDRGLTALQSADLVAGQIELMLPARPSVWTVLDAMLFDQERFVSMGKAATANIFVSRALFERHGGFDGTLPSGGDWDFVNRSLRGGDRLAFAPTAIVRHHTRDQALDFLMRRWRIEHAFAQRAARAGLSLVAFNRGREAVVPRRFGFAVGYDSRRAAAVGMSAVRRWRLLTAPARYLVVPAVDVLAQAIGWTSARFISARWTVRD